ncbi:MAG: hypothetical protein DI539_11705 [Flavobacterium psychrophilum]|nr:MAG: hypothetical protein DI539_11705 [Flavobacterium psychrophilum]
MTLVLHLKWLEIAVLNTVVIARNPRECGDFLLSKSIVIMYTRSEAQFLKDYYWDFIIGRETESGEIFENLQIKELEGTFEVWCYADPSQNFRLIKATKQLGLIPPDIVLQNWENK